MASRSQLLFTPQEVYGADLIHAIISGHHFREAKSFRLSFALKCFSFQVPGANTFLRARIGKPDGWTDQVLITLLSHNAVILVQAHGQVVSIVFTRAKLGCN